MNAPQHTLRIDPALPHHDCGGLRIVTRQDPHATAPVFRAPALPTLQQLNREIPFTAHLGPRLRPRT
jgi:hypothetical protein